MSNNPVDLYVKAISEQAAKDRTYSDLVESENKEVTKKVEKNTGNDAIHAASHGHHHAYSGGDGSTEDGTVHVVHDEKTGKSHEFGIPEGKHSVDKIHKMINKHVPGGVHKDLATKMAHSHNENY